MFLCLSRIRLTLRVDNGLGFGSLAGSADSATPDEVGTYAR